MTCNHVLDMIDTLSFEERRSHLLAAIQGHTQHCEACHSALELAMGVDSHLKLLPEPPAPAGLIEVIHSHTALHARKRVAASKPRVEMKRPEKRRSAWALLLLGTMIVPGAQLFRMLTGEWKINFTSSPLYQRTDDFLVMLQGSPATLVLLGSLLLYTIGFFVTTNGNPTQ